MFDVIVWATDGSANADLSLDYVQKLAEGGQSRVVAVHVKELIVARGLDPSTSTRTSSSKRSEAR